MGTGGGGGSGKHEWPGYMQDQHQTWLNNMAAAITASILLAPYDAAIAYIPDDRLEAIDNVGTWMYDESKSPLVDPGLATMLSAFITSVAASYDAAALDNDWIEAQTGFLVDDLIAKQAVLHGVFEAGMQNINAALTNTFAWGEYHIAADIVREAGKAEGEIRRILAHDRSLAIVQLSSELVSDFLKWVDLRKAIGGLTIDANRLAIIAKTEEAEMNLKISVAAATWPLDLYLMGGSLLGSIGGGGMGAGAKPPSKEQSALAGAVSGAAMGAAVTAGNPFGAAIGAVVGGVAGYFA